ncbi:tyrosine-type recombinase/integrase [uncultured Hyphomonas sp.]|uniref:tyrosine-type recombinase/integrase n=1 Tax=uncultured Hyphomonas sp. TaxID=225298 RepID=UPI002AAB180D|nr:tyrosine-type recombinase/integrase [uncultured Hyphomonas sp.]
MESQKKTGNTAPTSDTGLTRRKTVRINDQFVKALQPPPKGNRVVFDDRLTGFGVRITANSSIAFILNYSLKGRERRMTIGQYPTFTVLAARKEAEQLKGQIARGIDPLERRQADNTAPTVEDMWKRYEAQYLPKLADRSQSDQRAMFTKSILPAIGRKKVEDVTFNDCEALHRKITKDRPTRANRVIEVLRRNFNLAIKWGWLDRNPASGIERNPEPKRERYLSPPEIERLLSALDEHRETTSCDALKFILLTGCRKGEALNATWSQFDSELKIWTKPAATTKQRRLHRVPVSSPTTDLLKHRRHLTVSKFVFDGGNGFALTDIKRTWMSVIKAAGIKDARVHDLRHTFASIAVSQGQSLPVVGALLGHTQPQTTARYAHLFDDSLAQAVETISSQIRNSTL